MSGVKRHSLWYQGRGWEVAMKTLRWEALGNNSWCAEVWCNSSWLHSRLWSPGCTGQVHPGSRAVSRCLLGKWAVDLVHTADPLLCLFGSRVLSNLAGSSIHHLGYSGFQLDLRHGISHRRSRLRNSSREWNTVPRVGYRFPFLSCGRVCETFCVFEEGASH